MPAKTKAVIAIIAAVAMVIIIALMVGGNKQKATPVNPNTVAASTAAGSGNQQKTAVNSDTGATINEAELFKTAAFKDNTYTLGDAGAPVTITVFSDYRCPFCAVYSLEREPQIIAKYVASGKVRIEWHDTPIFGAESVQVAIAARAAGVQGAELFWKFNYKFFAMTHTGRGHPSVNQEILLKVAQAAGVPDLEKFKRDLSSKDLAQAVSNDSELGQSIGVSSTPSFLVGNTPITGAQPLEVFYKIIDQKLVQK